MRFKVILTIISFTIAGIFTINERSQTIYLNRRSALLEQKMKNLKHDIKSKRNLLHQNISNHFYGTIKNQPIKNPIDNL